MKFTGWVPTISGRLSFSAIGTYAGNGKAVTCNLSSLPEGCVFSCGSRDSKDGPLPAFLMRATRVETTYFLAFLEVESAELPFPEGDSVEMRVDKRGALRGTIIAVILGKGQSNFRDALKAFSDLAAKARDPNWSDRAGSKQKATDGIEKFWAELTNTFRNNPRLAPAFVRANVRLLRTGQADLEIAANDLYLTLQAKLEQRNKTLTEEMPSFKHDAGMAARQMFHYLRDIAHKHYHHTRYSDLASTTYLSNGGDDATWRRETQYGLVRMAITSRREDDALSHKQALGILSYAEAFQSQLAGWSITPSNKPAKRTDFFPYAFKPFRESIEARIRILDGSSVSRRATITFLFATVLSVLAVIMSSSNFLKPKYLACHQNFWECSLSKNFWWALERAVYHPGSSLLFAFLVAVSAAIISEHITTRRITNARDGISRALDAVMGDIAAWTQTGAWLLSVALVGALTAGLAWIAVHGFLWARALHLLAGQ